MLLGVDIITVAQPTWNPTQIAMLSAMRADICRFRCAPGFGEPPAMLSDFARLGGTVALLDIENSDQNGTMSAKAQRDLFDRGWLAAAQAAGVTPIVELGCEPDNYRANTSSPAQQAADVLMAATLIQYHSPVSLAVSLPTRMAYLTGMRACLSVATALCPHLYGYEQLSDGGNTDEVAILTWVLANTSLPLYLSEVGIDSPSSTMATKAQRILDGLAALDQSRVKGACVFTISTDPAWSHYALDMAACQVFGARGTTFQSAPVSSSTSPAPVSAPTPSFTPHPAFVPVTAPKETGVLWFGATSHTLRNSFRQAWEQDGGLAIFGYPISEEFSENGIPAVQYFERQVMEWSAGRYPAHFNVTYRLLGDEAAKSKRYIQ